MNVNISESIIQDNKHRLGWGSDQLLGSDLFMYGVASQVRRHPNIDWHDKNVVDALVDKVMEALGGV